MDRETFWRLVEHTRPADNDPDRHCAALSRQLGRLDPAEIACFDRLFREYHREAYRRDVWSVISEIDGGCSDDGFIDFRSWLVMQGQDVFETVLASPDYLGEITLEDYVMGHEDFAYLAAREYERKTGTREIPDDPARRRGRLRLKGRWVRSDSGFRRRWPVLHRLLRNPPEVDPSWLSWRSRLIPRMAREIERERRWSSLPVLADALEEAGCAEPLILEHRRAGTRHARTCWVVNFLLGRR